MLIKISDYGGGNGDTVLDVGGRDVTLDGVYNSIHIETEQGTYDIVQRKDGLEVSLSGEILWSSVNEPKIPYEPPMITGEDIKEEIRDAFISELDEPERCEHNSVEGNCPWPDCEFAPEEGYFLLKQGSTMDFGALSSHMFSQRNVIWPKVKCKRRRTEDGWEWAIYSIIKPVVDPITGIFNEGWKEEVVAFDAECWEDE